MNLGAGRLMVEQDQLVFATARGSAKQGLAGLKPIPSASFCRMSSPLRKTRAMPATKILWGQIFVVLAVVLATTWAATQWVAWRLGFQPQLGHPWFEVVAGVPVYLPPAFFWWWYGYDAYAPAVFVEGAYIAASGGFISIAVAIAMSVCRAREATSAATYGSARWATLAAALGLGLRLWIAGLLLGVIGQAAAVWAAKRDPQFIDVVRRHLRISSYLSV